MGGSPKQKGAYLLLESIALVSAFKKMHPAVFVTAGFFLILLFQLLDEQVLRWFAGGAVLLGVLGGGQIWVRTMRRTRYIFLSLLILFAWQTPGILIVPIFGMLSPTWDGLGAVIDPALRLLAVVSVIALMLRHLSMENWIGSLYVLLRPMQALGFSTERFAVRLRLVLDYIERRDLSWRHCLDTALEPSGAPAYGEWLVQGLAWTDRLLISLIFVLMLGYLLQ